MHCKMGLISLLPQDPCEDKPTFKLPGTVISIKWIFDKHDFPFPSGQLTGTLANVKPLVPPSQSYTKSHPANYLTRVSFSIKKGW